MSKQENFIFITKEDGEKLYQAGLETGYESGMNDAWEIARKLCLEVEQGGMDFNEYHNIFGPGMIEEVFAKFTAQEAKEKIDAWEKKREEAKKIRVGDVIKNDDIFVLVTCVYENEYEFDGFRINQEMPNKKQGATYCGHPFDGWEKTDKHFELSQIFALMG